MPNVGATVGPPQMNAKKGTARPSWLVYYFRILFILIFLLKCSIIPDVKPNPNIESISEDDTNICREIEMREDETMQKILDRIQTPSFVELWISSCQGSKNKRRKK